ncbi:hypothetical protein EJB05_14861, partial [Eragrostis curvula]
MQAAPPPLRHPPLPTASADPPSTGRSTAATARQSRAPAPPPPPCPLPVAALGPLLPTRLAPPSSRRPPHQETTIGGGICHFPRFQDRLTSIMLRNNLDAKPLWNHVNVIKVVAAGVVRFRCKHCGQEYNGSYSRIEAHLLQKSKCGIRVCPCVTASMLPQIHNEIAAAEMQ